MQTHTNALGQQIGPPLPDWRPPPPPPRAPMLGRFCRVEPLDLERHAAELYAANQADSEDRMWTYLSYGPFASLDEYRVWMQRTCFRDDPLFYAIIDLASEQALGLAAYLRITPAAGSIEVGHLAFAPALQHTPAATEAMLLMMGRAFTLGYRRYEWKCDALNSASGRAAQRLGLSFEGIFRQATVYKGRSRDSAWYATIDSEWPALEAAFTRWLDPANFDAEGRQRVRLSQLTASALQMQSSE